MADKTEDQETGTGNLDEQTAQNLELLGADIPDENDDLEQSFQEEQQQSAEDEAADRAARAGAQMAVSFAKTLTTMKFPYVVVDENAEAAVVEKAAPVVRKYNGGLPAWLEPYQEEIELGVTLASVGFGIYLQVKQHEAEEAEKAAKAKAEQESAAGEGETLQPEHEVAE